MKKSFLLLLLSTILLACHTNENRAQALKPMPDPVYGQALEEIYRRQKVKEVHVEREQFYQGKVIRPRSPHQLLLVDKSGQAVSRQVDHNGQMTSKVETTYYPDGLPETVTQYARTPQAALPAGHDPSITLWLPYKQTRYTHGKKATTGVYLWNASTKEWAESETETVWMKNDTTYTENVHANMPVVEKSRNYLDGKDKRILRVDYLTFSPKGLQEVKYYYYIHENGRTIESGDVDFEAEVTAYLEKNPQDARYLFRSEHAFNPIYDKIARHAQGTQKPNYTYTYDTKGRLMEQVEYGTKTTYERNAQGRAISSKELHTDNSGNLKTFHFNEKGLLEQQVEKELDGSPSVNLYYQYVFY